MSKVTMPEPVARQVRYFDSNMLSPNYKKWTEWSHFFGRHERAGAYEMRDLITTTQAEAYAESRVREALEEAAKICWEMQSAFGKDDKDRWLAIAESRIRSMIKDNQ